MREFIGQVIGTRDLPPREGWEPTERENWVMHFRYTAGGVLLAMLIGAGTYGFVASGAAVTIGEGLHDFDQANKPRTGSNTGGSVNPPEFVNPTLNRR